MQTKLSLEGIHYQRGEIVTTCDSITGELIETELLDDELNFDINNFNRKVVIVLEEISNYIDPNGLGKTSIFAVNDKHADLIVQLLKEIYTQM